MPAMFRGVFSIIIVVVLLAPFAAAAEGYGAVIGEGEVIERVITLAPDTLMAREVVGEYKADYMSSKSVFDTNLSANTDYTRNEFQQSTNFFGTRTDITNWNVGLAKKLPIGTSTALGWTNEREQLFGVPTIGGASIFPTGPTYESTLNFSVSHPLMKNFAGMVDRGTVKQAKKAFESADLNTKYQIARIANYSLNLYWQWVISYAYMVAWKTAVDDATHFLNITLERERLGTAENTDVLAARANLINRKNSLIRAERRVISSEKDLKVALGFSESEGLKPRDANPRRIQGYYSNKDEAISTALSNRWDYLAQQKNVERLNINLVSTKNQRWPEFDLVGTLAVNGLAGSYSGTMDDVNNPYWAVGATLSIPLENRAARGAYRKATHEKAKAVIDLKKMENDITNNISELLKRLKLDDGVLVNAQKVEGLQREKLKEEMVKYGYGRSTSELVILYQDDVVYAVVATLEAWANYIQTVLGLKLEENVLLVE